MKVIANPKRFSHRLSEVETPAGLGDIDDMYDELTGYVQVISGRADAPPGMDTMLDLMEVAAAYYARAKEIEMAILWEEQNRNVIRGSPLYKFRTGPLRSFIEMAKMMCDLGSRRLTQERLLFDARYDNGGNDG